MEGRQCEKAVEEQEKMVKAWWDLLNPLEWLWGWTQWCWE